MISNKIQYRLWSTASFRDSPTRGYLNLTPVNVEVCTWGRKNEEHKYYTMQAGKDRKRVRNSRERKRSWSCHQHRYETNKVMSKSCKEGKLSDEEHLKNL